ncbi:ectonucleoside triphosphate diphosphohydrolase 3 isoform X1 [Choloepus didactylus]|uniref:ectonucleoside triphosphate diphosphohydrolase 3 isoform X1 n=1 Tax=Choloepus didactylus TaxID=27675 RepID=UPI00189D7E2E|nr:ectonucleoside triphosphate diphosphohydrolase 3 isoform X1 [Choloepus didactylus]XP_037684765.1 ectonucleoside triphosphate diphosphohydrolase 3 isoform X1 [Choloepus didactylus]XP_037684767.1 ectonucleoside triphosphate diphosphohydrolase 3 isoform X1 [Choloepus didactylus]
MFTVLTRQPCEQAGLKALSRTPAIVALVVLLVSVVVLVAITLIQIHQKEVLPPGLKYGIVLDAGSSRTTVYVYQWPAEKENNTGVVSQTFRCSVRGSGISSYGNNPQDVPKAFEDCMQKVKLQIPAQLHGSTRIHLGATAGMRLLRSQNETAANEVLASIQNYFKSQPFDFRGAQIISGQEEGVYGWITANYLMGNFLEKNLWRMWVHPHGVETTGALDLGGASTQISFAAEEKVGLNTSGLMQVSLYGYVYTLYTHSFQCYGRNEAEKRFLARLLQNSPTKTDLINPCYPRNYTATFPMSHIFNSLCTADLSPASYHPDDIIAFEGTGDPLLCREKVAFLFDFKACQDPEACSFDGVYQPKVKGPFVAFAGFYYTASALNLSGSFSLDIFNSSTWNFCSQNWSQLPLLLPRFDEEYARSYCFSAHYIYHLLVNGYKFTEETWPQIHFKKEVGNSSIAWSLGYMLSLTNQIPAESPLIHLPMQPRVFVGILSFFAGVALLCLAFLVYLCTVSRIHRSSQHAFDHTVDSE